MLTPTFHSCLTQRTSYRIHGLNSAMLQTRRVAPAIEIVPFADDSYPLRSAATASQRPLGPIVRLHPSTVAPAGHTDVYASAASNAIPLVERTRSVRGYVTASLKTMEVTMPTLVYLALGESHPVAPNSSTTSTSASGDRRVELLPAPRPELTSSHRVGHDDRRRVGAETTTPERPQNYPHRRNIPQDLIGATSIEGR